MNEIDDVGKYSIAMSAISILIAILLGISIVTGILLVHKYKLGKEEDIIDVRNNSTSKVENENNINQSNMFTTNHQIVK